MLTHYGLSVAKGLRFDMGFGCHPVPVGLKWNACKPRNVWPFWYCLTVLDPQKLSVLKTKHTKNPGRWMPYLLAFLLLCPVHLQPFTIWTSGLWFMGSRANQDPTAQEGKSLSYNSIKIPERRLWKLVSSARSPHIAGDVLEGSFSVLQWTERLFRKITYRKNPFRNISFLSDLLF